ncbi:hypothetical protein V6N13_033433 [Hibiscus sabdariffa]
MWSGIPAMAQTLVFIHSFVNTDDELSFSFHTNASLIARFIVTNETGVTKRISWNNASQSWTTSYMSPIEQCDFYGHCGPNGYCNPYVGDFECTCFPGFEPKTPQPWLIRDGSGGCVRKSGISMCGNGEGFVKFPHTKVPDTSGVPAFVDMSIGLKQCKEKCLRNCSCMAYASANSDTNGGVGCLTWHGDLVDAREYTVTGQDLYIRVDKNELARYTKKGLVQKKGVLAGVIVSSASVFLILVIFLRCWVQRQRRGVLTAERSRKGKNIISFTTFEDSLGEKEIDERTGNGDLPYFDFSTIAAATDNFSSDNKLGQGLGVVEVVDLTLGDSYSTDEMLKCIQIFLLCVQEHATHRPTMSTVVSMLSNEAILSSPEQPAFIERKIHKDDEISSSERTNSVNAVSITMIQVHTPRSAKGLAGFVRCEDTQTGQDLYVPVDANYLGRRNGRDISIEFLYFSFCLRWSTFTDNCKLTPEFNCQFWPVAQLRLIIGIEINNWLTYHVLAAARTERSKKISSFTTFEESLGRKDIDEGRRNGDLSFFDLSTVAAATNNFSSDNKLGQGGFGPVYKVWELWKEGKAMQAVDSALGDSYPADEILKCIQIGLMCVQEHAADRPVMSAVVSMLSNETTLQFPKPPAFFGEGKQDVKL